MPDYAKLVLIRGLPGSGKTTMARTMTDYKHLETDMYFESANGYVFDSSQLQVAHNWCLSTVRKNLETGHKVVVANTFVMKWEMKPYIEMAEALGIRYRVITATGNWKSLHSISLGTFKRMQDRWEALG
jgi:predicted kinase